MKNLKYFPMTLAVTLFALQLITYLTQISMIIPTAILMGLIIATFLFFCFSASAIALGFVIIAIYHMIKA
jgi:hypothetical protein